MSEQRYWFITYFIAYANQENITDTRRNSKRGKTKKEEFDENEKGDNSKEAREKGEAMSEAYE